MLLLSLMFAAAAGPEPVALAVTRNFGRCVAEREPAGVRRVLAMDFRTQEYNQALRRLSLGHDRCMPRGGQLQGGRLMFAGSLAEAMVVRHADARLLSALAATAVPAARSPTENAAQCVVRSSPAQALALLRTAPASDAEKNAGEPLLATLSGCMPSGQKLEMNRPALRAVLALAAWRVASNAPAPFRID